MGSSGQYMPSFTIPMHRTLGMSTEFMASMHNLGSTFGEKSSSSFPHYQGLGPLATQFRRPLGFLLSSQDLVQKALEEGRLQFCERRKMQVDSDPMKVEEALYFEPLECMMVETTDCLVESSDVVSLDESFKVMMVETTDRFDKKAENGLESAYSEL
ncbi:hypothetical protein KIW84_054920 [Lathyrus oleraceus]|uniref:Uncharacterized protein n=1 Tax=Pisum sativum TaxID=3888 RepID=A0A9D4WUF8_PEA|nr:hypothetical protein KIW84_054920 [Pisum sativum]